MTSIYDINSWDNTNTYSKNDIIEYNNYYYYSLKDNNINVMPGINSSSWGGITLDHTGTKKPIFLWTHNYGSIVTFTPKTKIIQFGDGYAQRMADGINNRLINADLNFEGRAIAEIRAITHFLYARAGTESFYWTPPMPFNKKKLFICKEIPVGNEFYNNYNIRTRFEEVNN